MMIDLKNEGLEVVAMLTVSFDEGDGGSAIEQVETHTLLDEGAHDLCRHSEALAGYAVRDARIAELEGLLRHAQKQVPAGSGLHMRIDAALSAGKEGE